MPDLLTTRDMSTSADSEFEADVLSVMAEIRPALEADGGDVELVSADRESGLVEVRLVGACRHCAASWLTLSYGIEARLKQALPAVTKVVALPS